MAAMNGTLCLSPTRDRLPAAVILGSALVNEAFGDGLAVDFVGDDQPRAQVEQDAEPAENRENHEHQAYQSRIYPEVSRKAGAHPRNEPPVLDPAQVLGSAARFIHSSIMPDSMTGLT
jgi:hypothetical protein